jgi:hypothetical protein
VAGAPTSLRVRPSLDDVWRWAPLLAIGAYLLCTEIRPHDFWWHLRSGQLALEEGRLSDVDRFSFTRAGETWVNQSWLMQIALYELYRLGDVYLVLAAHALAITLGYAVLVAPLARAYGPPAATLSGVAAFLLGIVNVGVRPQSISFLCFGALLAAIESHRRGRSLLFRGLPLLFAFWVNAHGAFAFGGVALALYVIGRSFELRTCEDARRRLAELWGIGIASCAALALNPEGPRGAIDYLIGFVSHGTALASIEEFQPLQIRSVDGALFFTLLGVTAIALARARTRPAPDQIAMLLCFGLLALWARRFSAWYGFVLAPVLAAAIAPSPDAPPRAVGNRARNISYLAFAATALVWVPLLRFRMYGGPLAADTPVEAGAALCRSAPEGARVLQDLGFASYQIFHCPRLRVFTDTRIELYPQELWNDYLAVLEGRHDWQTILSHWGITHLLVPSEAAPFAGLRSAIATSGQWTEIHRDSVAIVLARRDAAGALSSTR